LIATPTVSTSERYRWPKHVVGTSQLNGAEVVLVLGRVRMTDAVAQQDPLDQHVSEIRAASARIEKLWICDQTPAARACKLRSQNATACPSRSGNRNPRWHKVREI
jgi:hypothetical protein